MELSLAPEEVAPLRRILTGYLSDLRVEISNTESYDLRSALKREEAIVKSLVDRLQQAEGAQS